MPRDTSLDFLKGLLILSVPFGHAIQYVQYHGEVGFWRDPLFVGIYSFHMPLFMMLSGLLSYKGIQTLTTGRALLRKLSSYLLPILCWGLLIGLLEFFVFRGEKEAFSLRIMALKILNSLWFLRSLLLSFVVLWVLHRLLPHWRWRLLFSYGLVLALPENPVLLSFKFSYLFFVVGYLIADYRCLGILQQGRSLWLMVAAIAWACSWYAWSPGTFFYNSGMSLSVDSVSSMMHRVVAAFSASYLMLYLIGRWQAWLPGWCSEGLIQLGQITICVYTTQELLFVLLSRAAWLPLAGCFLAVPLYATLILLCSLGVYWFCRKSTVLSWLLCGRSI